MLPLCIRLLVVLIRRQCPSSYEVCSFSKSGMGRFAIKKVVVVWQWPTVCCLWVLVWWSLRLVEHSFQQPIANTCILIPLRLLLVNLKFPTTIELQTKCKCPGLFGRYINLTELAIWFNFSWLDWNESKWRTQFHRKVQNKSVHFLSS